jgi:hypothetical protein
MKTNQRTKRVAGVVGLLAALSLTAAGCQVGPTAGKPPASFEAPAEPKVKLATLEVHANQEYEGWNSMDGEVGFKWSEADKAGMEKNGKAILEVLIEDHPEFTVEGFTPTPEIWNNEIAPKLKPLTLDSVWQKEIDLWMKPVPAGDGRWEATETTPYESNPILTNHPQILNGDKYPGYDIIRSWKSLSGETCSPSDKPYDVKTEALTITTRPEGNSFASAYPLMGAQLEVTIHCKEGGKLKYGMKPNIQMKKQNGEWVLSGTQMYTGSGIVAAAKIEK